MGLDPNTRSVCRSRVCLLFEGLGESYDTPNLAKHFNNLRIFEPLCASVNSDISSLSASQKKDTTKII